MFFKFSAFMFCGFLLLSGQAFGDEIKHDEAGKSALFKLEYDAELGNAEALATLQSKAENGDVKAQCTLGKIYEGNQVYPSPVIKRNYDESVKWYLMAAKQGDIEAENALGWLYHFGNNGKQDDAEAMKWFRKAAEQGDEKAPASIGAMYLNGWGVKQDYAEAVKWMRVAGDLGNRQEGVLLGDMYEKGQNIPPDIVQAYLWYSVGGLGWKLVELSKKMTPEQKAAAQSLASEWQLAHPPPPPNYKTGDIWTLIPAMRKGDVKARSALEDRAEKGDIKVQMELGKEFFFPQNGLQDYKESLKWWKMAAEQGNVEAQLRVGSMYEDGKGVEKNYSEAAKWYQKAADQGDATAKQWLDILHDKTEEQQKHPWIERVNKAIKRPSELPTNPGREHNRVYLAELFREKWTDGYDLEAALKQLNEIMVSIDAQLSLAWGVKDGYISYYFKPETAFNLTETDLSQQIDNLSPVIGKGPKEDEMIAFFYKFGISLPHEEQFVKMKNGLVRIDLRARFPSIAAFASTPELQSPPPYLKDFLKDKKLEFVRSEARNEFKYVYSYDLEKHDGASLANILTPHGYLTIEVTLTGQRNNDHDMTDIELRNIVFLYPMGMASWGYGPKPAKEITYPPKPIDIPCEEFGYWYGCYKVDKNVIVSHDVRPCSKMPEQAPVCPEIKLGDGEPFKRR